MGNPSPAPKSSNTGFLSCPKIRQTISPAPTLAGDRNNAKQALTNPGPIAVAPTPKLNNSIIDIRFDIKLS